MLDKIQSDMYQAMKARDTVKAKTLRVVFSKLKDKKIAKRDDLTEPEILNVLQSLAKQRKESIAMFKNGGREDLVEQEQKELEIIEDYLPKMMTDDEIKGIVKLAIKETGAESLSDIGKIMQIIMQKGAGRIDGKKAQAIARGFLQ